MLVSPGHFRSVCVHRGNRGISWQRLEPIDSRCDSGVCACLCVWTQWVCLTKRIMRAAEFKKKKRGRFSFLWRTLCGAGGRVAHQKPHEGDKAFKTLSFLKPWKEEKQIFFKLKQRYKIPEKLGEKEVGCPSERWDAGLEINERGGRDRLNKGRKEQMS